MFSFSNAFKKLKALERVKGVCFYSDIYGDIYSDIYSKISSRENAEKSLKYREIGTFVFKNILFLW